MLSHGFKCHACANVFHISISNPLTPLNLGLMIPSAPPSISTGCWVGNSNVKNKESNSGHPPSYSFHSLPHLSAWRLQSSRCSAKSPGVTIDTTLPFFPTPYPIHKHAALAQPSASVQNWAPSHHSLLLPPWCEQLPSFPWISVITSYFIS